MTTTTLLLIAIVVIMVAATPVVALLKDFLPTQVEKSGEMETNENRVYVLHSEIHEAQARLTGLTARRNQVSAENHRIDSEGRKAEKAIREIENQPPLFVHEVGEPRANLKRFAINVSIAKSSGETRTAPVNPIWRCANVAEVWASTQEEAKQLVEVSFPFKLGFNKSFVREAPQSPAPPPAAAGANTASGDSSADTPAPASTTPSSSMLPANAPGRELRRPAMTAAVASEEAAAPAEKEGAAS